MPALVALLGLFILCLPATAAGHPNDLHLLEAREIAAGRFEVVFKPGSASRALSDVSPTFPSSCTLLEAERPIELAIGPAYGFLIDCPKLDEDSSIWVEGMTSPSERVLGRVTYRDGTELTTVLAPDHPALALKGKPSFATRSLVYLRMGVEHFATGFDHVLFVLGLILLIRESKTSRLKRLVATVTLFTLAHSLTLSLATLGVVAFPPALVESLIALSILAVAVELAKFRRGITTLGARKPWLIAFVFGLLHGFGFAGALREAGLPDSDIPLALLFFNTGIEVAQVLFVVAVLALCATLVKARRNWPSWAETAPIYVIGTLATFWTVDRIWAFWS
jgi:hypothetical protein